MLLRFSMLSGAGNGKYGNGHRGNGLHRVPLFFPRSERYAFAESSAPAPTQGSLVEEPWLPRALAYMFRQDLILYTDERPGAAVAEHHEEYDVEFAFKAREDSVNMPPYMRPHLFVNNDGAIELVIPEKYRRLKEWPLIATELSVIAAAAEHARAEEPDEPEDETFGRLRPRHQNRPPAGRPLADKGALLEEDAAA